MQNRYLLPLCLLLPLALNAGCGSEEEETPQSTPTEGQGNPTETPTLGGQSTPTPDLSNACDGVDYAAIPGHAETMGIWDKTQERMVFFGGDRGQPIDCESQNDYSSQTWAYYKSCNAYKLLDEGGGPSPRARHSVVYHEEAGQMLVFGGRAPSTQPDVFDVFNEVWAFDFAEGTWQELETQGPAPARFSAVTAFSKGKLIVHGGNSSTERTSYVPNEEVFILDLETLTWSELETSEENPGERLFHTGTISQGGDILFVYGGGDEKALIGSFFADLWALNLTDGTWTQLHNGRGFGEYPLGRIASGMIHDAPRNRLLLWAGHDNGSLGNDNELWAFNLGSESWEFLRPGDVFNTEGTEFCNFPPDFTTIDAASPERRYQHITTITDEGHLMTFGGKTDCGIVNDIWSFDPEGETWQELSPATTGEVCLRAFAECSSLCY